MSHMIFPFLLYLFLPSFLLTKFIHTPTHTIYIYKSKWLKIDVSATEYEIRWDISLQLTFDKLENKGNWFN